MATTARVVDQDAHLTNHATLEQCAQQAAPQVISTLIKAGVNFTDAEDALQSAFVALLRTNGLVRHPVSWLIKTAMRIALRTRSQSFVVRYLDFHDDIISELMMSSGHEPGEVALARARLEEIGKEIVNTLDTEHRTVLTLSMAGSSLKEIAAVLDISTDTAHRYLAQARHTLRLREINVHGRRLDKADRQDPHTSQLLKRTRDDRRLLETISKLPRRQGQVLALSAQGHQPRHIARMLDIRAGAVRANLCYARRHVAEAMGWRNEDVIERLKQLSEVAEELASA
jgi:RNA polymerase sigma factor (sigma-70 family)